MLTFGPSGMQRLLQQHETIKQTMTGLSTISAKIDVLQQYNENGPVMTEVRLQNAESSPFAYLAVHGSNGAVYKLCEGMDRQGQAVSLIVNELKTPLTLYLDKRHTWTIVAFGPYQQEAFFGQSFKVDGAKQSGNSYVLPSSLRKPEGSNLWQLSWGF